MAEDIFARQRLLMGDAAMERLAQATVAVFGVGGVGSYVVEALARSGVGRLLLVDHDQVSPTNLNRQLIALHSTLGQRKVEAAYRDESAWARSAILNVAYSGKFSSDRTIQEYVDEVWHLDKVVLPGRKAETTTEKKK